MQRLHAIQTTSNVSPPTPAIVSLLDAPSVSQTVTVSTEPQPQAITSATATASLTTDLQQSPFSPN